MQSGWAEICHWGSRPGQSLLHTGLLLRETYWPPAFERVGNGEPGRGSVSTARQVCSGEPTQSNRVGRQ